MRTLEKPLVKHIDLLMKRYPALEVAKEDVFGVYLVIEETPRPVSPEYAEKLKKFKRGEALT